MQIIHFTKIFSDADAAELIRRAQITGAEGYDLVVRPGYAVGPDNVEELPAFVKTLRDANLSVPMITAPGDFLSPRDELAPRYLKAMAAAEVPLIKLGYFKFDPNRDYWEAVDEARREFAGWEKLAREYGVTVCYHTHSGPCMGQNASSLAHLIHGFDPQYIGGYLDPGHLRMCGEPFTFAAAVIADQLKIVALKDFLTPSRKLVPAGEGHVNWKEVFEVLATRHFNGPLTVHTEMELPEGEAALPVVAKEILYFKNLRDSK
jgi:sugar phosphate isomerase/epimerase